MSLVNRELRIREKSLPSTTDKELILEYMTKFNIKLYKELQK